MSQVLVTSALSGVYFKASEVIETLDEFEGKSGQFIKTFALNDKRNKNGWRAVWEGIVKHLDSFKKRPGIEFMKCNEDGCDLDHTEAQTKEMSLQVQEPFRKTTIVGTQLDEPNHKSYFIHESLDPEFFEKVKSGEIKYVSPSIWPRSGGYEIVGQMENGAPMIDVYDWDGLHDAFVNKPAFGDDAKITATCEGKGCPVKLLTAKEKQTQSDTWDQSVSAIVLLGDAVEDCVTRKIKGYGQRPDDQKLAIFFSECRKSLGGIVDQGDIPHLQEIQLLHNKKKRFMSVNEQAYNKIQKLLESWKAVDETKVFEIIRQDTENSSFNSCTCSASQMSPEEEKEMNSKLTAMEHENEEMKSKLSAQEEKKEKEAKGRIAAYVAILKGQTEEEREKTVEAVVHGDCPDEKMAMEHAEKEVKTAKKGMKDDEHMDSAEHEKEEQNAKIAVLEATISRPLVDKMAQARALKGATEDEITAFKKSYETKSLKAVESDYKKEEILINETLSAAEESEEKPHFPFSGSESTQLSAKSLEDTFNEVTAY